MRMLLRPAAGELSGLAFPIVILTGAGISQESGLSTFRDADGIWAKVRIEDVATPEAFDRDAGRVYRFYNERRAGLLDPRITPNAAHKALAELERKWPDDVLIVTQNIDNLHNRAGSRNLIHMHGELLKARCQQCATVHEWPGELSGRDLCPACARPALRPHVVWFGEMPLCLDRIYEALSHCGLFAAIGTSGNVYPAAGFVTEVARRGDVRTVEINLQPSPGASQFAKTIYGPATRTVPEFVNALLDESLHS